MHCLKYVVCTYLSTSLITHLIHKANSFCAHAIIKRSNNIPSNLFVTSQLHSVVELRYTEFELPPDPTIISKPKPSSQHSTTISLHHHMHEPVIFLHGLLGNKRNFSSICTALARQLQKRRRIFSLDLRNHGENDDWRDEMGYPDMAGDVISFMDGLGIEKCVLVGHSMGGKVAKATALLNPDRVSGLVALDIAPVAYTEDDKSWTAVKVIIDCLAGLSITEGMTKRDVDKELRSTIEDPALRAFILTNLEQQKDKLQWKINLSAIAKGLPTIAGFDLNADDDLKYEGDTFIISGGASRFIRHTHMDAIANFFPNHMLTTVRGAGHWVHAEAPDDTIALLRKYLDR